MAELAEIIEDAIKLELDGEVVGRIVDIRSAEDASRASELKDRVEHLIIRAQDWKVIPLENLIAVEPAPTLPGGDDRAMLAFRTLTLCPFDARLIDGGRLDMAERDWLNSYHARVRAGIGPLLTGDAGAWLKQATAPV